MTIAAARRPPTHEEGPQLATSRESQIGLMDYLKQVNRTPMTRRT
jgi:hypothetical protein